MAKIYKAATLLSAMCFVCCQSAIAGRPFAVDDANVNDPGVGHVEVWYARMPGKVDTWNVAPAFSPFKDFEVSTQFTRNTTNNLTLSTLQAKWRITPSLQEGCNFGISAGFTHVSAGSVNAPYVNGLATCNHHGGALHMNLGISDPNKGKSLKSWGVAYEHELGGATGHVEVFGQESAKPTAQIGLRKDIVPGLQIDGTVGRSDGTTVFSVGMKKIL